MRINRWTTLTSGELWAQWASLFESEDEAIVVAIWTGNRLVKQRAASTRRKFYSLKDAFIERHQKDLVAGYRVREEYKECWDCNGTGEVREIVCAVDNEEFVSRERDEELLCWGRAGSNPDDMPTGWYEIVGRCQMCGGTGKYRSRWLYLHVFNLGGQTYSFHSYVKPALLKDEYGEDKEQYGGKFTEQELAEMALPMSGILRILGYVAVTKWGMSFSKYDGIYL